MTQILKLRFLIMMILMINLFQKNRSKLTCIMKMTFYKKTKKKLKVIAIIKFKFLENTIQIPSKRYLVFFYRQPLILMIYFQTIQKFYPKRSRNKSK